MGAWKGDGGLEQGLLILGQVAIGSPDSTPRHVRKSPTRTNNARKYFWDTITQLDVVRIFSCECDLLLPDAS